MSRDLSPGNAREQYRNELATGQRSSTTFDAVWRAACREEADDEFDRLYRAPQRRYLDKLRAATAPAPQPKGPVRAARLTKWRHALKNAGL